MELGAEVFKTRNGTPYLKEPGVVLIAKPNTYVYAIGEFLDGFDSGLEFSKYLDDDWTADDGDCLCKVAGQLCYMSFGPKRTGNDRMEEYLNHIKESGHGSVFEHANYSFLFYGISRSLTHELVRHRAGFAFSQVSQRYVDGSKLRFVERPEFQNDELLHIYFERSIDEIAQQYETVAQELMRRQKSGEEILSAEAKTDLRKKVNQCARAILPNYTEAPIIVTANARAWRHFLEMRGSVGAEVEIRRLAVKVLHTFQEEKLLIFSDYSLEALSDGTQGIVTRYRKV